MGEQTQLTPKQCLVVLHENINNVITDKCGPEADGRKWNINEISNIVNLINIINKELDNAESMAIEVKKLNEELSTYRKAEEAKKIIAEEPTLKKK